MSAVFLWLFVLFRLRELLIPLKLGGAKFYFTPPVVKPACSATRVRTRFPHGGSVDDRRQYRYWRPDYLHRARGCSGGQQARPN